MFWPEAHLSRPEGRGRCCSMATNCFLVFLYTRLSLLCYYESTAVDELPQGYINYVSSDLYWLQTTCRKLLGNRKHSRGSNVAYLLSYGVRIITAAEVPIAPGEVLYKGVW